MFRPLFATAVLIVALAVTSGCGEKPPADDSKTHDVAEPCCITVAQIRSAGGTVCIPDEKSCFTEEMKEQTKPQIEKNYLKITIPPSLLASGAVLTLDGKEIVKEVGKTGLDYYKPGDVVAVCARKIDGKFKVTIIKGWRRAEFETANPPKKGE